MTNATELKTKETTVKEGPSISPKEDQAYSLISRELTEDALKNKDVVRMIINERDRLQAENTKNKEWQTRFHESDKIKGVLEDKFKTYKSFEVLSVGVITIGSIIAGYALNPFDDIFFGIGLLLILVGIIAKTSKIL